MCFANIRLKKNGNSKRSDRKTYKRKAAACGGKKYGRLSTNEAGKANEKSCKLPKYQNKNGN